MARSAVVVIDMLNDFVTGSLKCEDAARITPNIKALTEKARKRGAAVIYANDCHTPQIDAEFRVWEPHAVKGTEGAKVVEALKPQRGDYVVEKKRYSSFYETGLDDLLRELKVDTVVLTGLHTNCCVQHTASDAFFRGYRIKIPEDCVGAFTAEDHKAGLKYLKTFYKAELTTSGKIFK